MVIECDDDVKNGIIFIPTFWNDELGEDEYWMLRELESKPEYGKLANMLGFPSETRKFSDIDDCCTFARLEAEELGVVVSGKTILDFVSIEQTFVHGVTLSILQKRLMQKFVAKPTVLDVEHGGWYTKDAIFEMGAIVNTLRIETVPALKIALAAKKDVLI